MTRSISIQGRNSKKQPKLVGSRPANIITQSYRELLQLRGEVQELEEIQNLTRAARAAGFAYLGGDPELPN